MIPAAFDYVRPESTGELTAVLAAPGSEILAGGQSLITDLKLRRKAPRLVVDIAGVPELASITLTDDGITFGAMTRQTDIVSHPVVAERLPLLVEAGAAAADPMVRHRGTLVGACCEVAPGGDWLAAALALDGVVLIDGASGRRELALTDFVRGPGTTDLGPGEFVYALRIPSPIAGTVSGYQKVKHVSVGWSVASAAIAVSPERVRIAVSGAPTFPQRLFTLETAFPSLEPGRLEEAIDESLSGLEFRGDYFASPAYRRKRLAILLGRALRRFLDQE